MFSNQHFERAVVETALRDAGVSFQREARVERTWLDTFDLRLTSLGMRLETARGRATTTTLFQADHPPAFISGPDAPLFATDVAAGPFRERLARAAGVRAFLPVATLTATSRVGELRNPDAKVVARVVIFDNVVLGTGASLGWAIEVDELVGYDGPSNKLVRRLHELGLVAEEGDLFDLAVAENLLKLADHSSRPVGRFEPNERALHGYPIKAVCW